MRVANRQIAVSCLLGFLGVGFGAFGAHAMKARLSFEDLEIWKTATLYLLVHAVASLVIALAQGVVEADHQKKLQRAVVCFFAGSFIFSGSLFGICLTGVRWLGAITPVGGVLFLTGWVLAGISFFRMGNKAEGGL
jgi:uncharacterized membrane protein YgdD (TMEM256/DUF423 family)